MHTWFNLFMYIMRVHVVDLVARGARDGRPLEDHLAQVLLAVDRLAGAVEVVLDADGSQDGRVRRAGGGGGEYEEGEEEEEEEESL
jgi:hypothetical protein